MGASGDQPSALLSAFLAGVLRAAGDPTAVWAPTVNGHVRLRTGPFSPRLVRWGIDDRTAAVRLVGRGANLRLECRCGAGVDLPPDAGLDAPVGARRRIGAKAWAIVGALTALISAFAVIDLTLIAWGHARGTPALGGALIAVWAVGSVAGGLVIAARHQRETRLGWRLLLVTAGIGMQALTLPPVVSDRPWVVAVVLLIGGAVIPAAVAAGYDRLTDVVPANRRAEIFGWLGTATTAGTAAAGPVAGATFEHYGPAAAVAIAAVAAAVATALATGR